MRSGGVFPRPPALPDDGRSAGRTPRRSRPPPTPGRSPAGSVTGMVRSLCPMQGESALWNDTGLERLAVLIRSGEHHGLGTASCTHPGSLRHGSPSRLSQGQEHRQLFLSSPHHDGEGQNRTAAPFRCGRLYGRCRSLCGPKCRPPSSSSAWEVHRCRPNGG